MIVPISLENKIEVVSRQLETLKKHQIPRFHVDIIDGLYADNVTIAPADLQQLDFAEIELDLHLLVDDPTEWIPECVAIKPKRIIAQIERMGRLEYFVEAVKEHKGIKVYLGLGIETDLDNLSEEILSQIEGVLLMAVKPGFGGNPFLPAVLPKITKLREKTSKEIFIDGGMNPETYRQVLAAGASEAGANTFLWRGEFAANYEKFMEGER